MARTRSLLTLALFVSGVTGCGTTAVTPPDRATVNRKVGEEIERICALPDAQRQAEIRRVQDELGLELQCADPAASENAPRK